MLIGDGMLISDGRLGLLALECSSATLASATVGSFGLSAMKTMKTACCLVFRLGTEMK